MLRSLPDFSAVSVKTGQSVTADSDPGHTFVSAIAEVNRRRSGRNSGDKLADSGGLVRGEGWGPPGKVSGVYPSSQETNEFLLEMACFDEFCAACF